MPSPALLRYFESLQRCNLQEINDKLRQFCLAGPHISLFEDDSVLVVKHVFSDDDIANVVSACERLQSLWRRTRRPTQTSILRLQAVIRKDNTAPQSPILEKFGRS